MFRTFRRTRAGATAGTRSAEPPSLGASVAPGYLGPIDPLLPEDLRVPWGWIDLLILVVLAFFGTIGASLVLVKGFAISGVNFHQVQTISGEKNLFLILNQVILSLALPGISRRANALWFSCTFLAHDRLAPSANRPDAPCRRLSRIDSQRVHTCYSGDSFLRGLQELREDAH